MPDRTSSPGSNDITWISPSPGSQITPGEKVKIAWSSDSTSSKGAQISICDSQSCIPISAGKVSKNKDGHLSTTVLIPDTASSDIHFEMALPPSAGVGPIISPTFGVTPSPAAGSNSPDARAHPPPSPPPPAGPGGGYPVVPPVDPNAASPVSPVAVDAVPTPAVAQVAAVPPIDSPVAPNPATPAAVASDPASTWVAPPASSWTPDIVATWKADAVHTAPPDPLQTATAQVAWSPSALPLPLNATLDANSTLSNSTLANSTASTDQVSAPSGLAVAGITIPLILSSLCLLIAISYCARKRRRAVTSEPRTSDLEEGKSFPGSSSRESVSADPLLGGREVAYPGHDYNGVSVIPRDVREIPTIAYTQASPIAPSHHATDRTVVDGRYGLVEDGGSVIYEEPSSLAVPARFDMRPMEAIYPQAESVNVLYSDGSGNFLTPIRIVDSASSRSGSTRCLTPRSALEVHDTLGDLPSSSSLRSHSHSRSSGSATSKSSRRAEEEPWKCQDCGSAKLLRSSSADRVNMNFFGSTYWSPSRRSSLSSTDYGDICSCPPKPATTFSTSRRTSRGAEYPSAPASITSGSSGSCSCSSSCSSSSTIPRPLPPASITRQQRTRRRQSTCETTPLSRCDSSSLPSSSGRSSPELPPSLRLGRPASSSSLSSATSTSSSTSSHRHIGSEKAAAKWLHHLNGASAPAYAGSIATEGHGHSCPSHSHHTRSDRSSKASKPVTRSYTSETAQSADLPSPWAPLRPKAKHHQHSHHRPHEEWRWERVPVAVYDALERTESRSTADTSDRMWRR